MVQTEVATTARIFKRRGRRISTAIVTLCEEIIPRNCDRSVYSSSKEGLDETVYNYTLVRLKSSSAGCLVSLFEDGRCGGRGGLGWVSHRNLPDNCPFKCVFLIDFRR